MELSVLIAARNEQFLSNTVEDVLAHAQADTEIIVVLDGAWADPPLKQHDRVKVVHLPESIGQRAAINLAARLSQARYVMKLDGHCSVAAGFDLELIRAADELGGDVTQIPAQKNLHVYNWVCPAGHRSYHGPMPTACAECQSPGPFVQEMVWQPRRGTTTTSWTFDATPHFQYDKVGQHRQVGDICDVMSSLGACFFMRRDRFLEIGGLDEGHGSWGSFGIEVACKSWLSGGRHVVNKRTWFAHLFRVGGLTFPYPMTGEAQERARSYARELWFRNSWPQQTRPLSWLVEKFRPASWTQEQIEAVRWPGAVVAPRSTRATGGCVYYSDCRGDEAVLEACRRQLARAAGAKPIVSVTLKPVRFARNIALELERGYLAMFRQILAGLEALETDYVFLTEHDVLYAPAHFDFIPQRADITYYNQHVYKVDAETGRALHYRCSQTSGLCADRQLLIGHYRRRVALVEQEGYRRSMGFEPGTRQTRHGGVDDLQHETWMSAAPNVDIRHGQNLTPSRWRKEEFRNQKYTAGWTEAEEIPGWGLTAGRFPEFLRDLNLDDWTVKCQRS